MKKGISASIERYILKEKVCTTSEISKKFKISWNTAEKYLLELVIAKKTENIKKEGVNLWIRA